MAAVMPVKISMTVMVDREEWERQYGIDAHMVAVIRDDARAYVRALVAESPAALSGAVVEVKG